jgi:hypothetical protein
VTTIEEGAFMGCDNLTSVTLSDNLKSIGKYAFGLCPKLKGIMIPDKVKSIEDDVFSDCWLLKSASLPKRFKNKLPEGFFADCSPKIKITFRDE